MKIDLNTSLKNNIHENSLTKMIDNPLPDQVIQDKDNTYLADKYYEHCQDTAHTIAIRYDLKPDFIHFFTEWYTDLCLESDEGYSLINDKSLIDDWWNDNKEIYEATTPYIEDTINCSGEEYEL